MAAKYFTTTHTHPFSFDTVASAFFQRYPNPMADHVLTEDTLHRELKSAGTLLYTRRLLTKTDKVPKWGEKWIPSSIKRVVPLIEESQVDMKGRKLVTYTRNIGLSRFMLCVEKVCYHPNPLRPDETLAIKEVWVESGLYGIRSAVKNFGIERFKKNCTRATEGFNHVMEHLHERQHFLNDIRLKKIQEIKIKGETVIRNATDIAKSKAANKTTVFASSKETES